MLPVLLLETQDCAHDNDGAYSDAVQAGTKGGGFSLINPLRLRKRSQAKIYAA